MVNSQITTLAPVVLVTFIGLIFTYDGYNLSDQLLAWTGWLAGGGVGGGAGWVIATNSGTPDRLLITAGGLLIGALIGRVLIPLVSWLAFVVIGFLSTSVAVLFVLAGQEFTSVLAQLNQAPRTPQQAEQIINQLLSVPAFQNEQILALTLIAGLVGGALASKFYELLITTTVSAVGAALLTVTYPLWEQALSASADLSEAALQQFSIELFTLFLVSGLGIQAYRYRDELDLPFTGGEYDPLEEK
jgi:hypothetical protein